MFRRFGIAKGNVFRRVGIAIMPANLDGESGEFIARHGYLPDWFVKNIAGPDESDVEESDKPAASRDPRKGRPLKWFKIDKKLGRDKKLF